MPEGRHTKHGLYDVSNCAKTGLTARSAAQTDQDIIVTSDQSHAEMQMSIISLVIGHAGATGIERALQLRQTSDKGARLRKKKALNDLLKALGEMGLSRSRSAVPVNDRTVQAWFTQVRSCHSQAPHVGTISYLCSCSVKPEP